MLVQKVGMYLAALKRLECFLSLAKRWMDIFTLRVLVHHGLIEELEVELLRLPLLIVHIAE